MPVTRSRKVSAVKEAAELTNVANSVVSKATRKTSVARGKKSLDKKTLEAKIPDPSIAKLNEEIEILKNENSMLLDNINKLKSELIENESKYKECQLSLKHSQERFEQLENEKEVLRSCFENQKITLQDYHRKLSESNEIQANQVSNIEDKLKELENSLKGERQENYDLKVEIDKKHSEIANLNTAIDFNDFKIAQVKSELETEKEKVKILESSNENFINNWNRQIEELIMRKNENFDKDADEVPLKSKFFEALDETSKKQIKQIIKLQEEVKTYKSNWEKLTEEIVAGKEKISSLEATLREASSKIREIEWKNSQLEAQSSSRVDQLVDEAVQARIKEIKLSHEEEIDEMNETMNNLKKRLLYEQQRNIEIISQLKKNDEENTFVDF